MPQKKKKKKGPPSNGSIITYRSFFFFFLNKIKGMSIQVCCLLVSILGWVLLPFHQMVTIEIIFSYDRVDWQKCIIYICIYMYTHTHTHTYIFCSSFSHSVVFLYFLALITEEGFLISPSCSLELCIQMGISFLFSFAFHFFSQLFVRPPQTTILLFCISFPWGWSGSLSLIQCHEPPSLVHQALCLSDLVP